MGAGKDICERVMERDLGETFCFVGLRPPEMKDDACATTYALIQAGAIPTHSSVFLGVIDEADAKDKLSNLLASDLAYGNSLIDPQRAREIANDFLALFGESPRFYSNGTLGNSARSGSWLAVIEGATFDTGVVAITQDYVGAIWVADED